MVVCLYLTINKSISFFSALIKIPMISATLPVPEEGNVTVTCPIQNMHITWDMFNIQSSWQEKVQEEQRMRRTYIDISNVSKKDQFHVITCKGVNATHKASASIMLVIPGEYMNIDSKINLNHVAEHRQQNQPKSCG